MQLGGVHKMKIREIRTGINQIVHKLGHNALGKIIQNMNKVGMLK